LLLMNIQELSFFVCLKTKKRDKATPKSVPNICGVFE